MKPVDNLVAAQTATTAKQAGGQDAQSQLAQRLWQLLLPLPEHPESVSTTAAAASSAAPSESHNRARDDRDRDASSLLASAAYVLASAVQQLGFAHYAQSASPEQVSSPQRQDGAVNLRLSDVDADGGIASLEIAHPQLGEIALEVELSQGALRVVASAPNELAARVLEAGQAVLAARLLRQGVVLETLEVVVASKRGGKQTGGTRSRRPRQEEP